MNSFTVTKVKNGYKLEVEENVVRDEDKNPWTDEVVETFVFNKATQLKKAIALLLKEED